MSETRPDVVANASGLLRTRGAVFRHGDHRRRLIAARFLGMTVEVDEGLRYRDAATTTHTGTVLSVARVASGTSSDVIVLGTEDGIGDVAIPLAAVHEIRQLAREARR